MAKRMRSDAFPLSSVDYEFIMQYRDAKPKTDILKKLRDKYPMTNSRFYKIWRGEEVRMVKWHQPISDESKTQHLADSRQSSASSMASISQDLSISESCLPDINQVNIAKKSNKQSSVLLTQQINEDTLPLDSIVTSDKRVKNRKLRSKSVRISDPPNVTGRVDMTRPSRGEEVKPRDYVSSIIHKSDALASSLCETKKIEDMGNIHALIEQNHKETEEAERESERILATM